jgi:phosphoenolpyruvate synthase/pyruvate phosphate dikinase
MKWVKSFEELTKESVDIAGGKGASLGEMIQSGIPVPEGFVVLADSFEQFIKETDLNAEIKAILGKVDVEVIHTVEEASEKIQSLILNSKMPKDIAVEIISEFGELGAKYVAVRSSATSEDSADAAWAGQLDTFLNTTKDNLLENVKKCWASLFTPRAIFYRFEKKLEKSFISVAVVIQKMIESEESGIAFSVHPVTEDRNQLIIEAGLGLGEAIVSGQITPDSYVVNKQDWNIIDINVNEQSKGLFGVEGGGNEWKELGDEGKKQVLDEKEITELSKLVVKIEDHYNFPVDIEWAKDKGKFYIVQSRPITTLSDIKLEEKSLVKKFKKEIRNDELLVIRGKFIPLFLLTDWLRFYDEKFKEKEGIYPVLSIKKDDIFSHYISLNRYLGISRKAIERFLKDPKYKEKIDDRYNKIKDKINLFYEGYFKKKVLGENELFNLLKISEEYLHELVALTLFIDFLDENIVEKTYTEHGLKLNFKKIFKVSEICDFPSFDLKNNIEIISESKNNLEYLKHIYTGYSAAPTKEEVKDKISKLDLNKIKKEIEISEGEINKRSKEKKKLREDLNSDEKSVADFLSWIIELRDDRKSLMNKLDVLLNESVQSLYQNWGMEKELSFISYAFDVLKGKKFSLDNINNVRKRQGNFVNLYYGNNEYSEKYENLEEEFKESESLEKPRDDVGTIKGQIANKGKVTGIARIIYDPKKFHSFVEGDILVTSMTRPEFVPMMKKASAIVTNEGGIACHAAIISRELNKPCIIGTKNVTEIVRDGDEIEVDADEGIVKVLNSNNIKTYKKIIERDTTLIMENPFGKAIKNDLKSEYSIDVFDGPAYFHLTNDKNLIFFENPDHRKKLVSAIGKKFFEDPSFIKKISDNYYSFIGEIRKFWKKGKASSIDELKEFVKLSQKPILCVSLCYLAGDIDPLPKDVEKIVVKIRSDDDFFVSSDNFVRKSLVSFGVDSKYVNLVAIDEVDNLPTTKELKERLTNGAGLVDGDFFKLNKNETIQDHFPEYNFVFSEDIDSNISNLRGTIGYKGKVRGIVCCIKNKDDMKHVTKKSVLVASMTTPDFLPAMKKAVAFVTDEGGVTCHAAIVSREMKKPCVIGTKIATQVLNEGDIVEVDANEGVVRIIKKA